MVRIEDLRRQMRRVAAEKFSDLEMRIGPAGELYTADAIVDIRELPDGFVVLASSQRRYLPAAKPHGAAVGEKRFPFDPDNRASLTIAVVAAIDWLQAPDVPGEFPPGT